MKEYPHVDGPFLNIGPECFTNESTEEAGLPDKKHGVICWRGENYFRLDCLPDWWLERLAYESAGAGAGAVMSEPEGRKIVMPDQKIRETLDKILAKYREEPVTEFED